jgi:alkylation response protein AidB-like acyl-CoA dehydrogenase
MEFSWPRELLELADEARALGASRAAESNVREDSWLTAFDDAFALELGGHGWLGMTWPTQYGGHGRTALERFVVTEALIEVGAPIAATWVGDRQIGPALLAFGTEEQKRRLIPDLVAGRARWCVGMSEPDFGSDLAHLRTRAKMDGDEFVVTGRKTWTSSATSADWMYLICRTDTTRRPHEGLSELIVDMASPGVTVSPIRDLTGASNFSEVTFDQVRVPNRNLVGELNGAWRQALGQLENERGGIDRLLANRAMYLDARARADLEDPAVRQEVAAIESCYRLGRLLVLRTVLGQAAQGSTALTKTFGTELGQRVATFSARVLGAEAMLRNRWSRSACYSQGYSIMGGTANILRNLVAERILELPRS